MAGYGTDQDFEAWLSGQGFELPGDAPDPSALRQIGSDYLDAAYEARLQCSAREGGWSQERAWPRVGHAVGAGEIEGIPRPWVLASYRAAWLEATQPGWATGTIDPTRSARREKVDVLEVEYFARVDSAATGSTTGGAVDAMIEGMVAGLLCPKGRRPYFAVI